MAELSDTFFLLIAELPESQPYENPAIKNLHCGTLVNSREAAAKNIKSF
jgi:hypothetical protein